MSDFNYHQDALRRAEDRARMKQWAIDNMRLKVERDRHVKVIRRYAICGMTLSTIAIICGVAAIVLSLTGCGGDASPDCTAIAPNTCRPDGIRNFGPEDVDRLDDEDKDGEA